MVEGGDTHLFIKSSHKVKNTKVHLSAWGQQAASAFNRLVSDSHV